MAFSTGLTSIPVLADLVPGHVFSGFLAVGDPHVFSATPGRRRDACFHETVCRKLSQAGHIARERNLYPMILGDLFHKDNDDDARMMLALVRALKTFPVPPLTIVGNHDMKGDNLTEANPLLILAEAGLLRLLDRVGFQGLLTVQDGDGVRKVAVGGTPYGALLPTDMAMAMGATRHEDVARSLGADTTVWLTHEDLAFEGAYPGSMELFEMGGIDMVINGHMHGTKKPVKKGKTAWYNFGNITRLALDMADHRPCVWEWSPALDAGMPSVTGETVPQFHAHELVHAPAADIFDFTGTQAAAALRQASPVATSPDSLFVEELLNDAQERRTDEAVFLRERLGPMLEGSKAPASAKARIVRLLEQAQAKLQAA